MDEESPKLTSTNLTAVQPVVQRSKTLRLKLAASLRLQAERVAHYQGVSVGYLITKAIEEKIARSRQRTDSHNNTRDGVHLVLRKTP